MHLQSGSGESTRYIPHFVPPQQSEHFLLAAPSTRKPDQRVRASRVDWVAVITGTLVYAVAFAAWLWLAK